MFHRIIEAIQKNKYRIILIVIIMGISFIGYRFFIGDKMAEMQELKTDLELSLKSKELADYQISRIPEYNIKIKDLNQDIVELKATFPSVVAQEDIIAKIAGGRERSDTLVISYNFTGINIVPMVDYFNSIGNKDVETNTTPSAIASANENPYELKGYVIEYNVALDFTGKFKQIYEFLDRLQGADSGVRVNSISVYTNQEAELLNCNIDITYVGLTESTDIEGIKDTLQYPGERKNIFFD